MVEMIKDSTKTQIVVGQNGIVWVKGDNENIAAEAILYIEQKSHIQGLTDQVKAMLEKRMGIKPEEKSKEEVKEEAKVEIKKGKVIKIYEKMESPISNVINAGIYLFDKKIFDFIDKTKKSLRGEYEITDSINMMIKEIEFKSVFLNEWRDVVYPWHLLDANEEILKKINKKIEGIVEKNTTIKGNVIVGKNSTILSGSYI